MPDHVSIGLRDAVRTAVAAALPGWAELTTDLATLAVRRSGLPAFAVRLARQAAQPVAGSRSTGRPVNRTQTLNVILMVEDDDHDAQDGGQEAALWNAAAAVETALMGVTAPGADLPPFPDEVLTQQLQVDQGVPVLAAQITAQAVLRTLEGNATAALT